MDLAELDQGFSVTELAKANEGLYIQFYLKTDRDQEATKAEGRPIYKDYEYIRVQVAGDRGNMVERPATPQDKRRFAAQYAKFKAEEEQTPDGIPLSEWPGISTAQIEELKYFKIYTVEQLAEVSDSNGQQLIAFHKWRDKARLYIQALKDAAPMEKLQAELQTRDDKIALLEKQLADVVADLKEQKATKKSA
jgi:hypothetical protein